MPNDPQADSGSRPGLVKSADGLALASMVLGIVSVLTFWVFPVCALFALTAFVLGRLAQHRVRGGASKGAAKGWATAGIVLASTGFLLSAALLGSCFFLVNKTTHDYGQKEFGKAIQELESDPEFKRQLDELRQDLKTLDQKPPEKKSDPKGEDDDDKLDEKPAQKK